MGPNWGIGWLVRCLSLARVLVGADIAALAGTPLTAPGGTLLMDQRLDPALLVPPMPAPAQ